VRVGVLESQVKTSMTMLRKMQEDGAMKTPWLDRRVPWKNEAAASKLSKGLSQVRRDMKHLGPENVAMNPRLASVVKVFECYIQLTFQCR
jgi:hypothetical protein